MAKDKPSQPEPSSRDFPFWSHEPFELSQDDWRRLTPRQLQDYNQAKRRWRLAEARRQSTHTKEQWAWVLEACGRCVRCGRDNVRLEKDHILPLFCGGSDGIQNLQPLCGRCNRSKDDSIDYRPEHVRRALGLI